MLNIDHAVLNPRSHRDREAKREVGVRGGGGCQPILTEAGNIPHKRGAAFPVQKISKGIDLSTREASSRTRRQAFSGDNEPKGLS